MNFTKEHIQAMQETELRRQVLIPLFREMGFKDVFEYHGGPQEQGKDIVMWKPGEFRDRTNYAVVVKATKITGQASGKSSANEVSFQIQQALGNSYLDPVTSESQSVHECIVVSSNDISKEAIQSIKSSLSATNRQNQVTFHNGERLWQFVEKCFPASAALNKLEEIKKCFEAIDPNYQISAQFNIQPKSSVPGNSPDAKVSLKFPDSAEGKAKAEEIQKHIKTGSPVIIPESFIARAELPKSFKALFGGIKTHMELELPARTDDRSRFVKIQVATEDNSTAELNPIELKAIQIGTEETTLNNLHQEVPWKITMVMNRALVTASCRFNLTFTGNVYQVLEAFKFHRVISKPATAKVIDSATGFEWMQFKIGTKENPCPQDIDELEFQLAEELAFIQSKAQLLIAWPQGKITKEVISDIFEIAEILRAGKLVYPIHSVSGIGDRKMAERLLEIGDAVGAWKTASQGEEEVNVLGQKISLGKVMTFCRSAFMSAEHRSELQQQLANPSQEKFKFVLTVKDDAPFEKYYPQWLPKGEAEVIRRQMEPPPSPP